MRVSSNKSNVALKLRKVSEWSGEAKEMMDGMRREIMTKKRGGTQRGGQVCEYSQNFLPISLCTVEERVSSHVHHLHSIRAK